MHAGRDQDGWTQERQGHGHGHGHGREPGRGSVRVLDTWRATREERTDLGRAAVGFLLPAAARQTTLIDIEARRDVDETGQGTWLAELVRYTLRSETVGIVAGPASGPEPERDLPPRLVATAGVDPDQRAAWWDTVRADVSDLLSGERAVFRPMVRRAYQEDSVLVHCPAPLVVRLALPLSAGGPDRDRRLGVLLVEFPFGERIMPDTLLTARALAHLVAAALDHERLARELAYERAERSAAIARLRRENENLEAALIQTAHELRGPLTTLRLGSHLVERHLRLVGESSISGGMSATPAAAHVTRAAETASLINQHVDQAERLLADLGDLARVRAGSLELRRTRCDLAALLRDVVAGQRAAWPARSIHLRMPDEEVVVLADGGRLAQVVGNYVTNALKYSPGEQPVEVQLVVGSGEVRVAVCDHGVGLAAEDQQRVWERFYRVERGQGQVPMIDGLGVGLFICRQIVERMGGMVGVESVLGEGSTFWFTLPRAAR
jgi:signal transduction histidine kinase